MGNNSAKAASNNINGRRDSTFTSQEKTSLQNIYQKLISFISKNNLSDQTNVTNNETNSSTTAESTGKGTFTFPSNVLLNCLIQNQILADNNTFQDFIESQTRSNKTILIRSIWRIVVNANKAYANVNSSELNSLAMFFQIILQLLSLDETIVNQQSLVLAQTVRLSSLSSSASTSQLSFDNNNKANNSYNNSATNDLEILENYIHKYAPCLPSIFETFFNYFCFSELNSTSPLGLYNPPHLLSNSDVVQNLADILPLSFYSTHLQGNWKKLYTSTTDGLSFNRIAHHVLGYDGPTCLLIHCEVVKNSSNTNITTSSSTNSFVQSSSSSTYSSSHQLSSASATSNTNTTSTSPTHRYHHIIGAFSQDSFKDSNRCHGSSNNCLFALTHEEHPVKIIRSRDSSAGAYQWLNTNTYSCPHGLGFGGSNDKGDLEEFRLFITDSLENCFVRSNCLTYELGDLVPTSCCDEKKKKSIANTGGSAGSSGSTSAIVIDGGSGSNINIARSDMKYFDILTLEIWGCGGTDAVNRGILAQQVARKNKDYVIQKARQVDKAQFFSNPFDREYLLVSTVGITTASNSNSSSAMDTDYAHAMEKECNR